MGTCERTRARQVNPLTAYAMLAVLQVPRGEWLAQARPLAPPPCPARQHICTLCKNTIWCCKSAVLPTTCIPVRQSVSSGGCAPGM